MTYMFRVRFNIGPTTRINAEIEELTLDESGGVRVFLKSLVAGQLINETTELTMSGVGYATEAQAAAEGERWVGALVLGTLSEFVGAEFDNRSPMAWISPSTLEPDSTANADERAYQDKSGLQVVSQSPKPIFVRFSASGIAGKNSTAIAARMREAFSNHADPDERSLLACEMYAASKFMPSYDSRFLMLMIAVEALIDCGTRSSAQVEVIERLLEHLESLPLSKDVSGSMWSTIARLKTESINSAGQRLASTLGERKYAGKSPKRFFRDCYDARSRLVHGNLSRPSPETIQGLIATLEHFVRDLVLERNGLS